MCSSQPGVEYLHGACASRGADPPGCAARPLRCVQALARFAFGMGTLQMIICTLAFTVLGLPPGGDAYFSQVSWAGSSTRVAPHKCLHMRMAASPRLLPFPSASSLPALAWRCSFWRRCCTPHPRWRSCAPSTRRLSSAPPSPSPPQPLCSSCCASGASWTRSLGRPRWVSCCCKTLPPCPSWCCCRWWRATTRVRRCRGRGDDAM